MNLTLTLDPHPTSNQVLASVAKWTVTSPLHYPYITLTLPLQVLASVAKWDYRVKVDPWRLFGQVEIRWRLGRD